MAIKKDLKEKATKDFDEFKKHHKLGAVLKIALILFILSITASAITNIFDRGEGKMESQNAITVSGHSEMSVSPDTTKFTISVTEEGKDIKSSQEAATNKINSAIAILKQNGVLDKNIKTVNYNTYPKYSTRVAPCGVPVPMPAGVTSVNKGKAVTAANTSSAKAPSTMSVSRGVASPAIAPLPPSSVSTSPCTDRTSQIVGYETNQSIEVKITDISKNPDLAGTLISAVGKVGVEASGLMSYVDNLDFIKQNLRDQAIQKAKVQAEDIAKSLDVRLGKVTSFSENSGGGYPIGIMMSAKAMAPADSAIPNLPVGENLITSDVSVSYSIR